MAEPSQSKIITIPSRFSGTQRKKIGNEVVRFIKRRTQSGIDVHGNLFAAYSKEYDKSGKVDLTLSSQMISSLELLSHGSGFIKIGFGNSTANDKARWIQGPYGPKRATQPVRNFVGINQSDLNNILENF